MYTQIHILVLEGETEEYFMCLWAQDIHTEILVCICLANWEITWSDGGSWIESLTVQHMPTLPEQSSYPTSRPRKDSVCPRLGWTWRSTVPSCWWSGRYIGLWRGGWGSIKSQKLQNNTQRLFTKFKDRLQLSMLYALSLQAVTAQL